VPCLLLPTTTQTALDPFDSTGMSSALCQQVVGRTWKNRLGLLDGIAKNLVIESLEESLYFFTSFGKLFICAQKSSYPCAVLKMS
jgi:hypothetical protein